MTEELSSHSIANSFKHEVVLRELHSHLFISPCVNDAVLLESYPFTTDRLRNGRVGMSAKTVLKPRR